MIAFSALPSPKNRDPILMRGGGLLWTMLMSTPSNGIVSVISAVVTVVVRLSSPAGLNKKRTELWKVEQLQEVSHVGTRS